MSEDVRIRKQRVQKEHFHRINPHFIEEIIAIKCDKMMLDEIPFIGDWIRERSLGCGGFGTVTLWKNNKIKEAVGKCL